jgi:hypothetical protein
MGLESETALSNLLEAERLRGQLPEDAQVQDIAAYELSVKYGLAWAEGAEPFNSWVV